MKRLSLFFLCFSVLVSCGKKEAFKPKDFSKIEIETLLNDTLLNVRAIEIQHNTLYFAASDGRTGFYEFNEHDRIITNSKDVSFLRFKENFRSLAVTDRGYLVLSIESPAILYKIDLNNYSSPFMIAYQETHPKAFYDSMAFWNDQEGIAIGDSIEGCLSIIITRDGGHTWTKLSCADLPKAEEGEGAFAASDTNIAIVGDKTWIGTTHGNIYYSPDKGYTWETVKTPIIQAKETEGIYSVAFYDELNGFAIGGDYTQPDANSANKIRTKDGGKTWELVAQNQNPSYKSCVQYIPNRKAKALVAVGFNGVDYSNDSGSTWKHLSDEGFYTIRFLNDSVAYAAGNGRISKLIFRE
ncbi:hypothetical protein SAMN05421824_1907 [Hyunsoonleella jejuensis]|uniref:Oxidoreductase n=1 Tax=Hyunsoonleella jejuensis TaxID=419940 RepID=A0A1H9GT26_9FLAO|nr:oxidoreductase [Hyunsoonleella jejuensis]SEQ53128.1 hypothetical protein SAMN05421824_1907 [Hyunsoonleella jejuensis]